MFKGGSTQFFSNRTCIYSLQTRHSKMPQTKYKELPHYVEYNVYIRVSEKVSDWVLHTAISMAISFEITHFLQLTLIQKKLFGPPQRNISVIHKQQQSYSGLHLPRRSYSAYLWLVLLSLSSSLLLLYFLSLSLSFLSALLLFLSLLLLLL